MPLTFSSNSARLCLISICLGTLIVTGLPYFSLSLSLRLRIGSSQYFWRTPDAAATIAVAATEPVQTLAFHAQYHIHIAKIIAARVRSLKPERKNDVLPFIGDIVGTTHETRINAD